MSVVVNTYISMLFKEIEFGKHLSPSMKLDVVASKLEDIEDMVREIWYEVEDLED